MIPALLFALLGIMALGYLAHQSYDVNHRREVMNVIISDAIRDNDATVLASLLAKEAVEKREIQLNHFCRFYSGDMEYFVSLAPPCKSKHMINAIEAGADQIVDVLRNYGAFAYTKILDWTRYDVSNVSNDTTGRKHDRWRTFKLAIEQNAMPDPLIDESMPIHIISYLVNRALGGMSRERMCYDNDELRSICYVLYDEKCEDREWQLRRLYNFFATLADDKFYTLTSTDGKLFSIHHALAELTIIDVIDSVNLTRLEFFRSKYQLFDNSQAILHWLSVIINHGKFEVLDWMLERYPAKDYWCANSTQDALVQQPYRQALFFVEYCK
jgi:hypothetical protein